MRSLILAAALFLVAGAVLLAASAGHAGQGRAAWAAPEPAQQTPTDGVRRITVAELRAAMDKGTAVVVDVRSAEAYNNEHIKGALSIPGGEIATRAKELPKDKLIVTYCA